MFYFLQYHFPFTINMIVFYYLWEDIYSDFVFKASSVSWIVFASSGFFLFFYLF